MFRIMFISTIFLVSIVTVYSKDCAPRDFGNGGTVCVCNATYCDDFPPLLKEKPDQVTVVETNKKGDRFKRSFIAFNAANSANSPKKQTLTIDTSKRYQTILGFGGAFTDCTGINIASLPKEMGDNIIHDYFSENGLEYTMVRLPIGASDFGARFYTYDDGPEDLNLTRFSLAKEDLQYKIPYIKLAEKLSPHKNLKYFGSTWYLPDWIKTKSSSNHDIIKGSPGGPYYQAWAHYFVKYLNEYKANGINMWGLTVQNEPVYAQMMTPEIQRDFVKKDLGPALEKAGYGPQHLKLMIFDDNLPEVQKWTDVILGDPDASKYVSGIAFHWYAGGSFRSLLPKVQTNHNNYFLLATEACILKAPSIGNWKNGESYAYDIIQDLMYNTTGWVDWNMAVDPHGHPGSGFDAPIIVDQGKKEYYKQPMYYAMGHYSKFLPPDSVRVAINEQLNDKLLSVALVRPDNAIVVIVLNTNEESVDLTINSKQGVISHTISAHSMQSYIWKS